MTSLRLVVCSMIASVIHAAPIPQDSFDPTVSLQVESVSLPDVVTLLAHETGFIFVVAPGLLDGDVISLSARNVPVSTVFNTLRDEYGICAWRHSQPTRHVVEIGRCD